MTNIEIEYIEGKIDVFIENNIKELRLRKGIGKEYGKSKKKSKRTQVYNNV